MLNILDLAQAGNKKEKGHENFSGKVKAKPRQTWRRPSEARRANTMRSCQFLVIFGKISSSNLVQWLQTMVNQNRL